MDLRIFALLLFLSPLQQSNSKPETVALVFGPEPEQIQFMQTSEAEKLFEALELKREAGTETDEDKRMHAALTNALGTIPTTRGSAPTLNTRERLDWEIRRGVRPPLQKPDRGN